MKRQLKQGEKSSYEVIVKLEDVAAFHGEVVHEVYSTFALARDAEYSTRRFILDVIEEDEEGIGTSISINHLNSAFVGEKVLFQATIEEVSNKFIHCSWYASVGGRRIAEGTTGQKIHGVR